MLPATTASRLRLVVAEVGAVRREEEDSGFFPRPPLSLSPRASRYARSTITPHAIANSRNPATPMPIIGPIPRVLLPALVVVVSLLPLASTCASVTPGGSNTAALAVTPVVVDAEVGAPSTVALNNAAMTSALLSALGVLLLALLLLLLAAAAARTFGRSGDGSLNAFTRAAAILAACAARATERVLPDGTGEGRGAITPAVTVRAEGAHPAAAAAALPLLQGAPDGDTDAAGKRRC